MKKLLAIGDAGANTGFARVMKGICDHLHNTLDWEVVVRGVNYRKGNGIQYDYEVLPVASDHGSDPMGFLDFEQHVADVQPDALFVLQDLWNIAHYMARKERALPTVCYFPVDTPNMKWSYALGLGAVSEAVSYTHFGAAETACAVRDATDVVLERVGAEGLDSHQRATWFTVPNQALELHCRMDRLARWQNTDDWNVIPHGFEPGVFEPRDRAAARKRFNIPEDAFVVGSVNTNQFRKRQDVLLRAFRYVLDRVPNAVLMLHCAGGDMQGWDLSQACRYHGIHRATRAVHHRVPRLSDEELCDLYNCFDAHVNVSGGEGWGLTSFEAAACGVPQIVPNWSATRELWEGYGLLARVSDYRMEPKTLNTCHALVDPEDVGRKLVALAGDVDVRGRWAEAALQNAARQKTWDQVGQGFNVLLHRALREPSARGMSFDELQRGRIGDGKSELAGVVTLDPAKYIGTAI